MKSIDRVRMRKYLHELLFELFENKRTIVWIALLILPFVLFEFREAIEDAIIQPYLSKLDGTAYEVLFGLLTAWVAGNMIIKIYRNYHFDGYFSIVTLYWGIIYIALRVNFHHFFIKFENTSIAYLDLIVVFTLVAVLIQICRTDLRRSYKYKGNSFFIEDNPITGGNEDLFSWKSHADFLANRINESIVYKSFAIGISAKWGTGKSSFYSLLKKSLDEIQSEQIIQINFNPWFNNEPKQIIHDFFALLGLELKKYDGSISDELNSYVDALVDLTDDKFKRVINFGKKFLTDKDIASKQYDRINTDLLRLNKKIIVFVDDIDRLTSQEVFEILKIIRNTSNFFNFFFIIGYDRNYVNEAVKAVNTSRPNEYLDKIIQYEMALPSFDRVNLHNYLIENLLENYEGKKVYEMLTGENSTLEKRPIINFNEYFLNLREVKKFINFFRINYAKKEHIVDLYDFLVLNIINFKFNTQWLVLSNVEHFKASYSSLLKIGEQADFVFEPSTITKEIQSKERWDLLIVSTDSKTRKIHLWKKLLNIIFTPSNKANSKSLFHLQNHPLYFLDFFVDYTYYEFYNDFNNLELEELNAKLTEKSRKYGVDKIDILLDKVELTSDEEKVKKWILNNLFLINLSDYRHDKMIYDLNKKLEISNINKELIKRAWVFSVDYLKDRKQYFPFLTWLLPLLISQNIYREWRTTSLDSYVDTSYLKNTSKSILEKIIDEQKKSNEINFSYLYSALYANIDAIDSRTRKITLSPDACTSFLNVILQKPLEYLKSLQRPYTYPQDGENYALEPFLPQIFALYSKEENDGFKAFSLFLRDHTSLINEDDKTYYQILVFYSYLCSFHQDNSSHYSDSEGNYLYFESYEIWKQDPLGVPVNERFSLRYGAKANQKIKEITNGKLSLKYI